MTNIYKLILVAAFVVASLLLATAPARTQVDTASLKGWAPTEWSPGITIAWQTEDAEAYSGFASQKFHFTPTLATDEITYTKYFPGPQQVPTHYSLRLRWVEGTNLKVRLRFTHLDTTSQYLTFPATVGPEWQHISDAIGSISPVLWDSLKISLRCDFQAMPTTVLIDAITLTWGSDSTKLIEDFEPLPPPETYLTVSPETLMVKGLNGKFLKPVKRGKGLAPNWANLLEETVVQGGFQPLASESDQAGGMVIGASHMYEVAPNKWKPIKDSANVRAWVRLSKWNFNKSAGTSWKHLQKTLEDKTGKHDLLPVRGLSYTTDGKNKRLLKQLTKLTPKKQDSPLFAELMALKLNIAASQLGKTPVGFGELVYDMDGSFLDEMEVVGIAAKADSMMTYWQGIPQAQFDSLYAALHRINRAFVRQLDTISFTPPPGLQLVGVALDPTPGFFLKKQSPPVAPRRLVASTLQMEDEEEFEDEEWEELMDGRPYASRLYQNYPNPFNPATTISFRVSEPSLVTLQVYDVLGRHIATLLRGEELDEGYETVEFAASGFASGVYFYRLESVGVESGETSVITRKMVMLR